VAVKVSPRFGALALLVTAVALLAVPEPLKALFG
jgi:hypothetical protein